VGLTAQQVALQITEAVARRTPAEDEPAPRPVE
jgi:hypothetical protein